MKNERTKRIILAAMFAAVICASTAAVRIPTPGTEGYIHPGDAFVILTGVVLGPIWGTLAAGIGSALADIICGYFIYVPITFIIKALIALFTASVFAVLRKKGVKNKVLPAVFGGAADIVFVGSGYFLFEIPLYGYAAAALAVPANIFQGVGGFLISVAVCPIVLKIPEVAALISGIYREKR